MSLNIAGQNVLNRSTRESLFLPTLGGGTPTVTAVGDSPIPFGTLTVLADSNGIRGDYATAASLNATSGLVGDKQYMRALNIQTFVRFRFNNRTGIRIFIGFTDQSIANMTHSDSPPGQYFGLWFSSTYDANNFYVLLSDGSHIIKSQLCPVDSNYHELFLRLYSDNGPSPDCQIQINDIVIKDETPGSMPGNTDLLQFMAVNISLDGSSKHTEIGKVSIKQDQ